MSRPLTKYEYSLRCCSAMDKVFRKTSRNLATFDINKGVFLLLRENISHIHITLEQVNDGLDNPRRLKRYIRKMMK